MSLIAELKRRKVFQVAAVYLVVAWLIMQIVDVVNEPLNLPGWFDTVAILLLAIGFPIALIISWAFELTADGVVRDQGSNITVRGGVLRIEYVLAVLLVVAIGLSEWNWGSNPAGGTPVVVVMDTLAPRGIYDPETRENSGTNADDLSNILRDLPIVVHKETVGSMWNREDQIVQQRPNLIMIHAGSFFHSMNLELGFGYDDEPEIYDEERWLQLIDYAWDKLESFLGYVGLASPQTRILVYSRGAWSDENEERAWVTNLEGRFPSLAGRVYTFRVPGPEADATFRDPITSQLIRVDVEAILGVSSSR